MSARSSRYAFAVLAAAAVVPVWTGSAGAAQITSSWIVDSQVWGGTSNWSAGIPNNNVPAGTTYVALLGSRPNQYQVNYSFYNYSIDAFAITGSNAQLLLNSGTLTTNGGSMTSGQLRMVGNYLLNSGLINATGGEFIYSAGTLAGSGSVNIGAGALLNTGTNSAFGKTLSQTLNNSGDFSFTAGQLTLNNGTLNNAGRFTFNTPGSSYFLNSTLTSAVNNSGTFAYGAGSYGVDTFTNSGTITLASGGSLTLGFGTFTFAGGSRVSGAGTFIVPSSTTLNVTGAATFASGLTQLSGGTLGGAGTITIDSSFTFNSGTLANAGSMTGALIVSPTATLGLGSFAGTRTLSRELINAGTVDFTSGQLTLNNGTLTNNGTFNFAVPGSSYFLNSTFTSAVVNNGTFAYGAGSYGVDTFTNNGTVTLAADGSLTLGFGTVTFAGNSRVTGAGTLIIPSSTLLNLTGVATTLSLGASTFSNNATQLNGGTIGGTGLLAIDSSFIFNSGTITGTGTVAVAPGVTLGLGSFAGTRALSRRLVNAGTLAFTSGQLTLNNGTLINNGTFNFAVPGSSYFLNSTLTAAVVNNGTFAYGVGSFGVDTFTNNGTVTIAAGGSLTLGFGTVTFAGGSSVSGAGTLIIPSSAALNVTGASTLNTASTVLNGGTIGGAGTLTINNAFSFNSGTVANAGSMTGALIVSPTATLGLGSFAGTRTLSRELTNAGTVDFTSGQLTLRDGSLVNNNAFVFNVPGSSFLINTPLTSTVTNNGTFAYGIGSYGVDTFTNNGTVTIASGGSLTLGFGTVTFAGGSQVTGGGTLIIPSSAALNVTGASTLNAASTVLNGGTIGGAGALTINNAFTFNSGTITGGGSLTDALIISPTATLGLGSFAGTRTLSRELTNAGTLAFTSSQLTLRDGSLLNNGTFSFTVPGSSFLINTPLTSTVINNGTFAYGVGSYGVDTFTNSGTVMIAAGGSLTLGFGTVTFAGGSQVTGGGTLVIPSSAALNVTGASTLNTASTVLNGGTIGGAGALTINNAFTFNSGTITGGGSLTDALVVSPTATLGLGSFAGTRTLSRELTNAGTLAFTSGQLTLRDGSLLNSGTFSFTVPGSSFLINTPLTSTVTNNGTFAYGAGSYGVDTFTNNGTVTIAAGGSLTLGFGTVTFAGGSSVSGAGTLIIPSSAALNVTGASTLNAASTVLSGGTIGGAGTLTINNAFTFSSGTLAAGGTLVLGSGATSSLGTGLLARRVARVIRNDGTLTFSAGVLALNNGTFLNTGTAVFNTANNIYTLSGASAVNNTGTFLLGAANFNLNTIANNGTIAVSSTGTLLVTVPITGVGTIDVSGYFKPNISLPNQVVIGTGTYTPSSSQTIGATQANSLIVAPGTTLTIQPDGTPTGTSRVTNLGIPVAGPLPGVLPPAEPADTPTARLDITDNALIVDYDAATSPGTTRYDAIRALIVSGRAGGTYTGNGITSSTAAASASTATVGAIGIAEASELFSSFPATFAGQLVDSTTILTRYTYLGDANLDRTVDTVDFARLLAGFATSTRFAGGDFNYDGVVNSVDFTALVANYGKTVPPVPPAAVPGSAPGALVPEPTAIGLLIAAALLPRRRR